MKDNMKNIAKSLSKFHSLMGNIAKDANNPFFKSKYAPLESILPAIKQPLLDSGLTFTQIPTGLCKLTTTIIDIESGETISGEYEMTPSKNDPQGQGATITYMRRYALVSMLGLNCDEDDDGNLASQKPKIDQYESKTTKVLLNILSNDEALKKASQAIAESETVDDLKKVNVQIENSKILTDDQKQKLSFISNEKMDSLDPLK